MATADRNNSSKIWETILALIPVAAAVGYANAFLHEMAICKEYGIPFELIAIDNTTIFKAIGNIFLFILFIFWFIETIYTLKTSENKWFPIYQRIYLLIALAVFYAIYCIINPPALTGWLYMLIFVVFYGLYKFLMPYRTQKNGRGYLDKLKKEDESAAKKRLSLDWLAKIIGSGGVIMFLIVFLMLWLSFWGGTGEAKTQKYYYVPSTYPNAVVLRIYGDKLICAPRIIGTQQIEREYFIVKMDDKPSPHLVYEEIGHLSVK